MPPAAAQQALVTFDMLPIQVLQSTVTVGGSGFGPLQQTVVGLPIAQGRVWGSLMPLPLCPVPIAR
jgi:hypothetical protein